MFCDSITDRCSLHWEPRRTMRQEAGNLRQTLNPPLQLAAARRWKWKSSRWWNYRDRFRTKKENRTVFILLWADCSREERENVWVNRRFRPRCVVNDFGSGSQAPSSGVSVCVGVIWTTALVISWPWWTLIPRFNIVLAPVPLPCSAFSHLLQLTSYSLASVTGEIYYIYYVYYIII